ncbi:MAG TPA: hypothetical protein VGH57_23170 [Amycolatopsis sp.]|jgi:hypothetical protein
MREEISETTATAGMSAGRRLLGMAAVAALVAVAGAGYGGTHEVSGGAGIATASSAGGLSGNGSGEGPNH